MKKIIPILGLLIIALGGTWFVFGRERDPRLILQSSFDKTFALQSLAHDLQLQLTGTGDQVLEDKPVEIILTLAGALALNEERTLSDADGHLKVEIHSPSDSTETITTVLEHRIIGSDAYLRLSALELPAKLPFDLSPFQDYWYHLAFKKLEAVKSPIFLRAEDWLVPTGRLTTKKIEGVVVWNFSVKPNAMPILARLDEYEKSGVDSRLKEIFRFVRELIPKMTGEIWIDKDDLYLRRLVLRGEIDFLPEDSSQKPIHVALELTAKLSDFNKAVKVEAPSGARELQELLAEFLGGLARQLKGGGLPSSGLRDLPAPLPTVDFEARVPEARGSTLSPILGADDRDGDGLTDTQEVFWGSDPNKFDSDGDGYSDGEEVKSGHNPNGPGRLF